jgi:hypothetical protein
MTTQHLSDCGDLAETQRARQSRRARLAAAPTVGALAGEAADQGGASPELTAALDRYAVPVVTLAADSVPPQAA